MVVGNHECAPDDLFCQEANRVSCTPWGQLCDPEAGKDCHPTQSCISGRCVLAGHEALAEAIVQDEAKEARLRPTWEEGRCATIPSACRSGCGCEQRGASPAPWTALLLLLLLLLLALRRRPA